MDTKELGLHYAGIFIYISNLLQLYVYANIPNMTEDLSLASEVLAGCRELP